MPVFTHQIGDKFFLNLDSANGGPVKGGWRYNKIFTLLYSILKYETVGMYCVQSFVLSICIFIWRKKLRDKFFACWQRKHVFVLSFSTHI